MSKGYITRENIFDEAARLFAERGYHAVSVKEIALAAGITEPAIYRHFDYKAAILDEIISRFKMKLKGQILTKKQVDKYIETDTPRQLLERCTGNFIGGDTQFMARAYRIVCMEHLTNESAMDVVLPILHDAAARSIKYVLDSLIERGKIPVFDTEFYSLLWTQSMFSGTLVWVSSYFNGAPREESSMYFNTVTKNVINMALTGKIPKGLD